MQGRILLCCALAASVAGLSACNETSQPPQKVGAVRDDGAGPRPTLPPAPGGAPVAIHDGSSPGNSAAAEGRATLGRASRPNPAPAIPSDAPIPPRDAQWTLLCGADRSLTHIESSRTLKQSLTQKYNRGDWYVIHGRDESHIYLGFYRTVSAQDDAREASRAHADLQLCKSIRDVQGDLAFPNASFVPLGAPDPSTKPEWSLTNIHRDLHPRDPNRAFWSLQIMAFKDNPLRKEAAVQAVEALREKGVEAYYYHGEVVSSVCVGAFPRTAIKAQSDTGEHAMGGSQTTLFVYADQLPSPEWLNPPGKDDQGRQIVRVAPRLEVVDMKLFETIKKFQFHAVNYEVGTKTLPSGRKVEDPSFIVVIPRPKGNGYYDFEEGADPGSPLAGDSLINPTGTNRGTPRVGAADAPGQQQPPQEQPVQPGFGRLRRFGER